MDAARNGTVALRTDGIGNDDIHANGDAYKQVYQHVDDERICTDRSKRLVACKLPDHGNVCRIEQLLQNARRRKRNGKPQNLTTERPVQHIHIRL